MWEKGISENKCFARTRRGPLAGPLQFKPDLTKNEVPGIMSEVCLSVEMDLFGEFCLRKFKG